MRFHDRRTRPARLALVLAGTLAACSSSPLLPEPDDQIVVDFDRTFEWPLDAWDFRDARLDGTLLELTVAYDGGCRGHQFWLVAVDGWQTLPDAGPVPRVAVPTLVAHDANGDRCEARITRILEIGLEPLIQAYRARFGQGLATILLRVPRGQGAVDTLSVDVPFPATQPLRTSP